MRRKEDDMPAALFEEAVRAAEAVRRGGIIIYPTDTVWGIGCDATDDDAVRKVYELKRSADKKGMIVLADSADMASRYVRRVPQVAWDLFEAAVKPLTLILPGCGVASGLMPEEGTLAVRIPKHDFCRALIKRLGRPLVSTSANFSGRPAPSGFDGIDPQLLDEADYVVDPSFEGSPTRRPSSIISVGQSGEVKIIRE